MPETPIEKLMGWLEREEEEFGLTGSITRTIDPEACRSMLREELGYEPSQTQVDLMYSSGRYRYEVLPEIGVRTELVQYAWGSELWYRDITTGRRLSLETVESRIAAIGF